MNKIVKLSFESQEKYEEVSNLLKSTSGVDYIEYKYDSIYFNYLYEELDFIFSGIINDIGINYGEIVESEIWNKLNDDDYDDIIDIVIENIINNYNSTPNNDEIKEELLNVINNNEKYKELYNLLEEYY